MHSLIPVDIEDALQTDLNEAAENSGFSILVGAPPIPTNLGQTIPYATVMRVGGYRTSIVLDTHYVTVDVWGRRWAQAQDSANKLVGLILALPDTPDTSVEYTNASIQSLPYNNPDLKHETLARVSFTVELKTRATDLAID